MYVGCNDDACVVAAGAGDGVVVVGVGVVSAAVEVDVVSFILAVALSLSTVVGDAVIPCEVDSAETEVDDSVEDFVPETVEADVDDSVAVPLVPDPVDMVVGESVEVAEEAVEPPAEEPVEPEGDTVDTGESDEDDAIVVDDGLEASAVEDIIWPVVMSVAPCVDDPTEFESVVADPVGAIVVLVIDASDGDTSVDIVEDVTDDVSVAATEVLSVDPIGAIVVLVVDEITSAVDESEVTGDDSIEAVSVAPEVLIVVDAAVTMTVVPSLVAVVDCVLSAVSKVAEVPSDPDPVEDTVDVDSKEEVAPADVAGIAADDPVSGVADVEADDSLTSVDVTAAVVINASETETLNEESAPCVVEDADAFVEDEDGTMEDVVVDVVSSAAMVDADDTEDVGELDVLST